MIAFAIAVVAQQVSLPIFRADQLKPAAHILPSFAVFINWVVLALAFAYLLIRRQVTLITGRSLLLTFLSGFLTVRAHTRPRAVLRKFGCTQKLEISAFSRVTPSPGASVLLFPLASHSLFIGSLFRAFFKLAQLEYFSTPPFLRSEIGFCPFVARNCCHNYDC